MRVALCFINMMSKADIRKAMIEKRMAMPAEARAEACSFIGKKILSIALPQDAVVAGYKAIRGEVDIIRAMQACHEKHYVLCLPSIAPLQRVMRFLVWRPETVMRKGTHGTLEPDNAEQCEPTVIWVPMVAFDRRGHRLGYGGGYYDATLAHLKKTQPNICSVGIAFACQEVETLPIQAHDVMLDFVVTEKEVITI